MEKINCQFMTTPCKPLLDNSDSKYFADYNYNQWNKNMGISKPPITFNRIHNSSSLQLAIVEVVPAIQIF